MTPTGLAQQAQRYGSGEYDLELEAAREGRNAGPLDSR